MQNGKIISENNQMNALIVDIHWANVKELTN